MTNTPFFISFFERSGSTLLVSLLNNHPDISCKMEVFDVVQTDDGLSRLSQFSGREAIRQKLDLIYSEDCQASGFKFKYEIQYRFYPDVYEYLLEIADKIRIIFLCRQNLLKAAVSKQNQMRLVQMGKTSNLKKDDYVELGKINLDIERALKYMNGREKQDKKYYEELKYFKHKYVVTYEEILENTEGVMENLYSFLGANENYKPSNQTVKITKDNLNEAITNYEELVERITGTRYEKYLEMN